MKVFFLFFQFVPYLLALASLPILQLMCSIAELHIAGVRFVTRNDGAVLARTEKENEVGNYIYIGYK